MTRKRLLAESSATLISSLEETSQKSRAALPGRPLRPRPFPAGGPDLVGVVDFAVKADVEEISGIGRRY